MATKNPVTQSEDASATAAAPVAAPAPSAAAPRRLSLGMVVSVQVAEGALLINNETGVPFAPGVPTPQTVTPTLLRRIKDGDLTLSR